MGEKTLAVLETRGCFVARVHAALLEGNDESLDVARRVPSQHATISLSDIKSRGTLYASSSSRDCSNKSREFPLSLGRFRTTTTTSARLPLCHSRGRVRVLVDDASRVCVATLALLLGAASADAAGSASG